MSRSVVFSAAFSEKKNATPAQISLVWLLAQKPFIVPIPGTRSADHLHENPRAIDVQLTPADLREIETALSKIEVHGGRMNEERMKAVASETCGDGGRRSLYLNQRGAAEARARGD